MELVKNVFKSRHSMGWIAQILCGSGKDWSTASKVGGCRWDLSNILQVWPTVAKSLAGLFEYLELVGLVRYTAKAIKIS